MDLARETLFAIERDDGDPTAWIGFELPKRSDEEISYHIMILSDAGLIEA